MNELRRLFRPLVPILAVGPVLLALGCCCGGDRQSGDTAPVVVPVEPAAPRAPLPDPCEGTEDCTKFGRCMHNGRECLAGSDERCRQSEWCRSMGDCTLRPGKSRCQPGSELDCALSERCREEGWCKLSKGAVFDLCVEGGQPASDEGEFRQSTLKQIRDLLHGTAVTCEETKAESRAILREQFSAADADKVWGDPFSDPRYSEFVQPVLQHRAEMLPFFDSVTEIIRSNSDILGRSCESALREAVTRAKEECLYDGKQKDTDWLLTVGQSECE